MKKIRLIAASIAAVVVIVICVIGLNHGGDGGGKTSSDGATVSVVVATTDMPAYSLMSAEMLTVAEVPQGAVPADSVAFTNVDEVVGSISLSPIVSGETILSNHLRGQESATVTPGIDENMRAVSIGVTDITGVSNLIRVGNKVDVYFIADDPDNSGQVESTLLLENITVLALDQRVSEASMQGGNSDASGSDVSGGNSDASGSDVSSSSSSSDSATSYETVTLHVSPEQAVRLTASQSKGTIWLSLRNQTDAGSSGDIASSTFDIL